MESVKGRHYQIGPINSGSELLRVTSTSNFRFRKFKIIWYFNQLFWHTFGLYIVQLLNHMDQAVDAAGATSVDEGCELSLAQLVRLLVVEHAHLGPSPRLGTDARFS